MANLNAVKETKKSYIVDLDDFYERDCYYTGTNAGMVLRFEKSEYLNLLESYNDYYDTELEAILDQYFDRDPNCKIKGIHVYRKGWIVE